MSLGPADRGDSPRRRPTEYQNLARQRLAKFGIGEVVQHRVYPFRGVIFDVDPTFDNSEEWWLAIPEEVRPHKDQPFYHLLAENAQGSYIAYVSEQNLRVDDSGLPIDHPGVPFLFGELRDGRYALKGINPN
ncbi:MAG: heat shock protein HspQ [Azospirillum sp.]|nr:heat shock protein HspQ [Azospirillum sp.]